MTIRWRSPFQGDWSEARNWDPERVPTFGDQTIFDQQGSYQVICTTRDCEARIISVEAGEVSLETSFGSDVRRLETLEVKGGILTLVLDGESARFSTLVGRSVGGEEAATLIVRGGGSLDGNNLVRVRSNGTLNVFEGSTVQSAVGGSVGFIVESGGRIVGNGLFEGRELQNGGIVSPGEDDRPGTITTVRGYLQKPDGLLDLVLGGTDMGSFSRLDARRQAILDGTLRIRLAAGYSPFAGDSFKILETTGEISGRFSKEEYPSGPGISYRLDYQPNAVVLIADPAPV